MHEPVTMSELETADADGIDIAHPTPPPLPYAEPPAPPSLPPPGSWTDLLQMQGRGHRFACWWAAAMGFLVLEIYANLGRTELLVEGAATLLGAAILLRNPDRVWAYLLIIAGAIVGVVDTLSIGLSANYEGLWLLSEGLLIGWALRCLIRRLGDHSYKTPEPERQQGPVSDPIKAFGTACVVTGLLHGIALFALVKVTEHVPLFFLEFLGFPAYLEVFPHAPGWVLEAGEDALLIVAGLALRVGAPWARAVLTVFCGAFAFEWLFGLFGEGETKLVYIVFTMMWAYGFFALASRKRTHELRVSRGTRSASTPIGQLHKLREMVDDRR